MCDLSALGGRYDGLPEALDILQRALGRGLHAWLVAATVSLGLATRRADTATATAEDLQRSVDLLAASIAEAPPLLPVVHSTVLSCRAEGLMLLRARAESDGDEARAGRLRAEAIEALSAAIGYRRRGSVSRARLTIELASIAGTDLKSGGIDAAIEQCRGALRSLRWRPMHQREDGYLTLAELLAERALENEAPHAVGLVEARQLCGSPKKGPPA